ncbi:serine hydrolase domain-containing protein [Paenibacillus sp. GCM10027627]|uniref:serine hydrolase domain-containing protein n=1 Tax=unclassified Paenibacillus TaxID=185978 RepID=UPI003640A4FC
MSLREQIETIVNRYDGQSGYPFTGAVSVLDGTGEAFEKGYGYANRSDKIGNGPDTRFGIASGCKIFTAVAICQLVERGALTFDTLLKDCVDEKFPLFDPSIRIHHLLCHTSGVPDYFDEETMDDFSALWKEVPNYSIRTVQDFLPLFQHRPMTFAPGEKFSYCNSGYILLGLVVEQVSGISFQSYVEKYIVEVCGMRDSGYFPLDRLPERTALGYIESDAGWRVNWYDLPIVGGPDGGAYTTVQDMDLFWEALLNHRLLSRDMTETMLASKAQSDESIHYGYGVWIVVREGAIFKYFVMGGDPGVAMRSSVYVKSRARAHVISNNGSGTWEIAMGIEKQLIGLND